MLTTLTTLFNEILYRPIFNALVFLYNIIPGHDFGIAIIFNWSSLGNAIVS